MCSSEPFFQIMCDIAACMLFCTLCNVLPLPAQVGLYVPGGSAILPSTALMLAVPATVAGNF